MKTLTSSVEEIYKKRKNNIQEIENFFEPEVHDVGVAIGVNNHIKSLDIFSSNYMLKVYLKKIIRSIALNNFKKINHKTYFLHNISNNRESVGLKFYLDQNISPVHQDLTDLEKHLQIRRSLYTKLGLPSTFINGKCILEVGAGSGHNSLYTASQNPKSYHICEPNPVAVKDIGELFSDFTKAHTIPDVFCEKFDDYSTKKKYDIVICEGWLGGITDYERDMIRKLSSFVTSGGLLIMSYFPPIGGLSSFLRRILAYRTIDTFDKFTHKTAKLIEAFETHLSTLQHLSRSHTHWVQDCLLNPHIYVGPLSPKMCMDILGEKFEVYSSVPTFYTDWRWYKSLFDSERKNNRRFFRAVD